MKSEKRSLTEFAEEEIRVIHSLSKKYNSSNKKDHSKALLALMGKHMIEIKKLFENRDPHFVVETGDLVILCLELIKEAGKSPDAVMAKCYKRYRQKLKIKSEKRKIK